MSMLPTFISWAAAMSSLAETPAMETNGVATTGLTAATASTRGGGYGNQPGGYGGYAPSNAPNPMTDDVDDLPF